MNEESAINARSAIVHDDSRAEALLIRENRLCIVSCLDWSAYRYRLSVLSRKFCVVADTESPHVVLWTQFASIWLQHRNVTSTRSPARAYLERIPYLSNILDSFYSIEVQSAVHSCAYILV